MSDPATKPGPLRLAALADAGHVNTWRWCEGLVQAGAELDVISFRGAVPAARANHRLRCPTVPGKLQYFAAVPQARRILRRLQPDLVLAYYATGYGTLGALAGIRPLGLVTAGSDVLVAPRNPFLRALLRFNFRRADLVTAWAAHMGEAAIRCGTARDKVFVLPRGIPVDHFAAHRCQAPRPGEPLRIISTRSLRPHYRLDDLIRAVALVRKAGVSAELTVAGEGPDRSRLEKLAGELCPADAVRFAGFVPNEQLPAMLAHAHVYVALIESDGVSASLLEAMAVGLLPLVPDNDANREWIRPGENGVLLGRTDAESVAAVIQTTVKDWSRFAPALAANVEIVRTRADAGQNALAYLEKFRQVVASYGARNAK